MIFALGTALAAPPQTTWFGADRDEWSLGAMTSWRTTPLRNYWAHEEQSIRAMQLLGDQGASRYSEPAIHVVGSSGAVLVDVSAGSEFGWNVEPRSFSEYSGFRFGVRLGVVAASTRAPDDAIDPLNLSFGGGYLTWIACCSASGSALRRGFPQDAGNTFTLHVANRFWLWEPLGLDLRYEVPLARRGSLNTVSLGVVFAARE